MSTTEPNVQAPLPDLLLALAKAASLLRSEATRLQRIYGANGYLGFAAQKAWASVHANAAEALVTLAVHELNAERTPQPEVLAVVEMPTDAALASLRDAFDWEDWSDENAARCAFARAALERWGAASIHLQDLKNEIATSQTLLQQLSLMEERARGEVWRWQGDGTDDLASMGNRMGVLIYACDLRAFLAEVASPATYVNSAGIVASDMPGAVIRKLLAAFHKATGTPNTDAAVQVEKGGA